MNHYPEKAHKSSEEEFMDALEKLEQTLETRDPQNPMADPPLVRGGNAIGLGDRQSPTKTPSRPKKKPKQEFLLSALEEAAADIDRFMSSKNDDRE